MYSGTNSFQNETMSNMANMSLMFMMSTPVFGNMGFQIMPSTKAQPGNGFPSIPYFPLEGAMYQAQMSNPSTSPVNITSGGGSGQQVNLSASTQNDQFGTPRVLSGYQAGSSSI